MNDNRLKSLIDELRVTWFGQDVRLATNKLQVQMPVMPMLGNTLGKLLAHTHVSVTKQYNFCTGRRKNQQVTADYTTDVIYHQ